MSSKVLVVALACMIPCIAGAQTQANASAQGGAQGNASVQPDGASANTNAVLSGSVDAKKAKSGDPVTAKTTEASTLPDQTRLPKGTKLKGHVTEAKAAGKGEAQSTLGFVFDRAVLEDGREVPINTTVRALAAAEGAADMSGGDAMGSMRGAGRAGGDIGGGATGAVGGIGGTAGGAVGGVVGGAGRVAGGAGNVAGSAGGTLGSTASASSRTLAGSAGAVGGVNSQGLLSTGSQGVFGMKDVNLAQSTSGAGSVVTSAGRNVRLESGTRMLLSVEGSATR